MLHSKDIVFALLLVGSTGKVKFIEIIYKTMFCLAEIDKTLRLLWEYVTTVPTTIVPHDHRDSRPFIDGLARSAPFSGARTTAHI